MDTTAQPNVLNLKRGISANAKLAADVFKGLSTQPKSIPPKYFYDERGSQLFQQIMGLPEYYPARCEASILTTYASDIVAYLPQSQGCILDLGSGDGSKTQALLQAAIEAKKDFIYQPVDIDPEILEDQQARLSALFPGLSFAGVAADYATALCHVKDKSPCASTLALFLGGNIGNFTQRQGMSMLRQIWQTLQKGDHLLIGFDLQKDPRQILAAYSDSQGITAQFNLNLLKRLNTELGADFNLDQFYHYATYEPLEGTARSFLVSKKKQRVNIANLDWSFELSAHECIHTENSYKYTLAQIHHLAAISGFMVERHFSDEQGWFSDSLWRVIK